MAHEPLPPSGNIDLEHIQHVFSVGDLLAARAAAGLSGDTSLTDFYGLSPVAFSLGASRELLATDSVISPGTAAATCGLTLIGTGGDAGKSQHVRAPQPPQFIDGQWMDPPGAEPSGDYYVVVSNKAANLSGPANGTYQLNANRSWQISATRNTIGTTTEQGNVTLRLRGPGPSGPFLTDAVVYTIKAEATVTDFN